MRQVWYEYKCNDFKDTPPKKLTAGTSKVRGLGRCFLPFQRGGYFQVPFGRSFVMGCMTSTLWENSELTVIIGGLGPSGLGFESGYP